MLFKQTFKDLMFRYTCKNSDAQQMWVQADVPVSLVRYADLSRYGNRTKAGIFHLLIFYFREHLSSVPSRDEP